MDNEKYLSNKLRKAIEKAHKEFGYKDDKLSGLYDTIENMDDEELKEYIYTNAQYFKQNIPGPVNDIPELKTLVNVEPNWGVESKEYSKLFGNEDVTEEEFLRDFDKIPYSTVEYVAEQHGMNPKKLEKAIREKQIEQNRADIANSYGEGRLGKAAGFITRTMFPNMVEGAVKEGRDPNLNEMAVDVGSNILYAVPWSKVVGGTGKVANVVANSIAPAASEGLDAMFSDKDKTATERLSNVGVGTLINAATPWALKRYGSRVARLFGEGAERGADKAGKFFSTKTAKDIVNEQNRVSQEALKEFEKAQKKYVKTGDINSLSPREKEVLYNADNLADLLYTNPSPEAAAAREIASQPGQDFNTKLKRSSSETREMINEMKKSNPRQYNAFVKDVETNWKPTFETSPIADANNILGSYATNKTGDILYADRPESIPMVGPVLSKAGIVESKKEKERQERIKQRKKNKEEALQRYRIMFGGR